MGDIRKNNRFQNGCKGKIYYNPKYTSDRVSITHVVSSTGYDIYTTTIDIGLSVVSGDMYCFGGQFCGEVHGYNGTTGDLDIRIPNGTFPEYGSALTITDYIENFDYIYVFDYAEQNNIIDNVSITNYTDNSVRKLFGFHAQQYDIRHTYLATLLIEPDIEKTKIDQMFASDCVAFFADDRSYSIDSMPSGWVFKKPHGGGSLNPIGRKITIKSEELKYSIRRGYQQINVILEG